MSMTAEFINKLVAHIYIAGTIVFTLYGQLIIKWKMSQVGNLPDHFIEKTTFLFMQFLNPWIISGFISAFIASLCWMAAMTKFELSYAYPYMGLSFILIMISSALLFHEPISVYKLAGLILVVSGIVVGAQ